MRSIINKRGAELTIGTVVVILLAVAVLVFLIWGFSTGWGPFKQWIVNLGGGSSNVDVVKQACIVACTGEQVYDYCTFSRDLKLGAGKTPVKGSCENFESGNYGFENCLTVDCATATYKQTCGNLGGTWKTSCSETEQPLTPTDESEEKDATKPVCCGAK